MTVIQALEGFRVLTSAGTLAGLHPTPRRPLWKTG